MISIIMPAYNAKSTIENSIKSILNQTYNDIKLYVINDGSTDSTAEIVNNIIDKDCRVVLINQDNSGPANARNKGLESLEQCEYIMFCDSDDLLDQDYIYNLYNCASNNTDIVIGGFKIVNIDGSKNEYYEPSADYSLENFKYALPQLYKANLLNQPWAKLIKYTIAKDIRFPDYRWGEDRPFIFDCLLKSNKISVCDKCGYNYIMRPGESLISAYYQDKPNVCIAIDKKSVELCDYFGINNDSCFRYMFTKSIFSCFTTLYTEKCPLTDEQKYRYISLILNNPYVQTRISSDGSVAIKAIYNAMKTRNVDVNIALAKSANKASYISPKLFQKIKHKK